MPHSVVYRWSLLSALLLSAATLQAEPNALTRSEELSGWKLLFDGRTTDGWRNYKKDAISAGWMIEDGALVRSANGAGDIITTEQYDNFELSIDFKVSKGGNSGIMFRVQEGDGPPWHTGPEIQINDHVNGHDPQHAGWLYQLYKPGNDGMTGQPLEAFRGHDEWNTVYLRISPQQCEIDLNGVRYASFKLGSDDWNKRVGESKFKGMPNFGTSPEGHICLQDHGNVVAFRNIKIRELPANGSVPNPVNDVLSVAVEPAFPGIEWAGWEPSTEDGRPNPMRPIVLTNARDGSGRAFMATQQGVIHVFDPKTYQQTGTKVYIDLRDRVIYNDRQNEEGFLGLAFHPKYKENGQFFVYYTSKQEPHVSIISRFTVKGDDPNAADPASEQQIMRIEQPFWNHNGGTIEFGPDGYLYVGLGDGGAGNDPHGNGQNVDTLLGSILRIDVDHQDEGKAYAIPKDNPFVGKEQARPEVYAYGVRNIWRLGFDRQTGDLWAADVGQNLWEEINVITNGGNYGWNHHEGTKLFGGNPVDATTVIDPVWEYDHGVGKSITGGTVYRGTTVPALVGKYVYADYVTGKVWALDYDVAAGEFKGNYEIPSDPFAAISFGEDESGELYMMKVDGQGQGIFKFVQR
ncbi:MAG: family 16 glycoside hydrolase [Planctomycetaceae bacterium]